MLTEYRYGIFPDCCVLTSYYWYMYYLEKYMGKKYISVSIIKLRSQDPSNLLQFLFYLKRNSMFIFICFAESFESDNHHRGFSEGKKCFLCSTVLWNYHRKISVPCQALRNFFWLDNQWRVKKRCFIYIY